MYTEDDLLPISALQHLAFCERQAALIHIEGQWQENVLTVEGEQLHEHVHQTEDEALGDLRIARGLRLRSLTLGLTGVADVVEFHRLPDNNTKESTAVELPGITGRWQPFIVEYKHGQPKLEHEDEVQLCAQAMCLEEMLGVSIKESAFFYGKPRRRHKADLNDALRKETIARAERLHRLVEAGQVPPPIYAKHCQRCSLIDICLPKLPRSAKKVDAYLRNAIKGGEPT